MAKDKKAKAAEKKRRVAEKQSKKAAHKEKKGKSKGRTEDDSDAEDVDLDAVLAEFAQKQAQFLKVTEEVCEPPAPRSSATLIASPSNEKELFLFGGEYFNGSAATFFNDLFIYNIDRDEWRQVTSPNSPLPRSGHAWCCGGNAGGIYLFGGEFSSPKQGTFYHYNDFWHLEPSSREWTKLETKGKGPPARSGHRMAYFKNYILLFGGFQDTSQQTKYLQDLWVYDCQTFSWHTPSISAIAQKPDARSSFSFLPHDSGAVICGGYSRVKATTTSEKQRRGGGQSTRSVLKPLIHQDTWFLRLTKPASSLPAGSPPTIRWERRKRPVNAPNPPRAGATMTYHKGRGVYFGGVHDVEESEEGIDSEFFDTLFAWNVERNRHFQLTLRRPRGPAKARQALDRGGRRGRQKADEEELLRNLAALETGNSIADADSMDIDRATSEAEDDTPAKSPKPVLMEMPHGRFNSQLAVQDDVVYIYGGTFESGDREYTFDDMWAIDLGRLDGVKEIFKRELENWQGGDEEESEGGDSDDGASSDEEDMEVEEGESIYSTPGTAISGERGNASRGEKPAANAEGSVSGMAENDDTEPVHESLLTDSLPHPRPFESLREFYSRTSTQWQEASMERLQQDVASLQSKSIKEVKKAAFDMAESKWWDCREEIQALEDERDEAGIGEVISISDRGGDGGGPSARRR